MVIVSGMMLLFASSGLAEQMCQDMMTESPVTEHSDMPDCPSKQGHAQEPAGSNNHCSSESICDCSPAFVLIKDHTVVVNKIEVSVPNVQVIALMESPDAETKYYTPLHSIPYSSPPLFLTNESFLI